MKKRILAMVLAALCAVSVVMSAYAGEAGGEDASGTSSESTSSSSETKEDMKEEEKNEKTEEEKKEPGTEGGSAVVNSGETAGISWILYESGELVMADGTVYTIEYPSKEAVVARETALEKDMPILRTQSAPMLRNTKSVPAEVPQSFSGSATVTWRDNGADSANFALSGFTGAPAGAKTGIGTVYMYCADPTAAAPYEGMVCSYTATFQSWDASTGTATYSLYAVPPGATDGVSRNEFGLIGYQRLGGSVSLTFETDGGAHLTKTVSDKNAPIGNGYYTLAGCTYGVYSDQGCTNLVDTLTTDESGNSNTISLPAGTYYVKETKAGKGLTVDDTVYTVTVASGETAEISATDDVVKTRVGVQKVSAIPAMTDGNPCYSLAGAKYGVYKTRANAEEKKSAVTTVTVGEDGYGETEDVLFVGETYYIRETKAPDSFQIDEKIYSVKAGATYKKSDATESTENPKNDPTAIGIEKVAEGGVPAAEIKPLSGTQFTVKYFAGEFGSLSALPSKAAKIWVIEAKKQSDGKYRAYLLPEYKVSGDDFFFLPGNPDPVLPLGTITIEETKAAPGYRLENSYTNGSVKATGTFLGVIKKNGDLAVLTYGNTAIAEAGFTATDTPIYGGVKIFKMDFDKKKAEAQGSATLSGAVFEIVSNNDYTVTVGGKNYKKGEVVKTITTDENGYAATGNKDLQFGAYTIREKDGKAPSGYLGEGVTSRNFTIKDDGVLVDMTPADQSIQNKVKRGGISLLKTDADKKKAEAQGDASLESAAFSITNENDKSVVVGGKEYKKGEVVLTITTNAKGEATSGTNVLPVGKYSVKEKDPSQGYRVNSTWKKPFTITEQGQVISLSETPVPEEVIRGGVQIQKVDADLKRAEAQGDATLDAASYAITNESKESVIVGGKEYKKGEVVLTIKTDKNGYAKTANDALPYGSYTIREVDPSTGYLLNQSWKKDFQIREDKKIVDLTKEPCEEEVIRGGVRLFKIDADWMKNSPQGDATLTGAAFAITNESEQVVVVGGKEYKKGEVVTSIRTNEEGIAQTAKDALPYGTYSVVETDPSTGYRINNTWKQTFSIRENGVIVELDSASVPEEVIRGGVAIEKKDKELDKSEALGGASLAGIEFVIMNTSKEPVHVDGKDYAVGDAVMSIFTDEEGKASTEAECLPYGTYTIQEVASDDLGISANDSYLLTDGEARTFEIREDKKIVTADKDGNDLTFRDQVKRNDILFRKVEEATDRSMALVPFVITNVKTGEAHVVVTDSNGRFSSKKYAHSRSTNKNDSVLEAAEKGEVIKKEDLDFKSGTWFGLGQKGSVAEVNDDLPAFPYGEYRLNELRCETNEGYDLIKDYPIFVDEDVSETDGEPVVLNNLHNVKIAPEIKTKALGDKTGDHTLLAEEKASITDTVTVKNLIKGENYILRATLMDAETGSAVKAGRVSVSGMTEFKAKSSDMEVKVQLALDASSLAGKTLVVYEELFLVGEDGKESKLAEHKDIADEEQTIYVPDLHTTFTDGISGTQLGTPDKEQKVKDTVVYTNLIPGKEVTLVATVMTVDEAGNAAPLTGAFGKVLSKAITFTPEKPDGEIDVEFVIDSSALAGKKVVCFEELRYKKIPIAIHADINDEDQTIWYPQARTVAADKNTKDHVAVATPDAVFTDTILYSGMKPGETYVAKATLIDTETGKLVEEAGGAVTGEATFIPTSESGKVTVELPVNAEALAGKKTVVFEEVFLEKGGKLVKVAEHKDPEDKDQQIVIPELLTAASVEGKKECVGGKDTILTDTVAFRGILPGKSYVIRGRLVDKRTGQPLSVDGLPITAEKAFEADSERGTMDVVFTFDSTLLAGKTVVVFEDLYLVNEKGKEIRIASHADVNDKEQSVLIKEPETPKETPTPTPTETPKPSETPKPTITPTPAKTVTPEAPKKTTTPSVPKTGDTSHLALYLALLGVAGAGVATLAVKKKKQQ